MKTSRTKHLLAFLLVFSSSVSIVHAAAGVPPQIVNPTAAQRAGTFLVDINYDLVDPDSWSVYVRVECSSDGGATYTVPMVAMTGDVGLVKPGMGKKIVWNAWDDWALNYTTNAKVRLVADDTISGFPPPPTPVPSTLVWVMPGSVNMSGLNSYITMGFYMAKCETTQAEYESVMTSNPSVWKGANLPVESVSWNDATNYCGKLTLREQTSGRLPSGWVYRLPTEAEWEYACRAGTTSLYSFGDTTNNIGLYAWYADSRCGNSFCVTHEVGRKGANRWGLHDMHGNVAEWCQDWFGPLPSGNATDPIGPSTGMQRVIRGGGAAAEQLNTSPWPDAIGCESARRYLADPTAMALSFPYQPNICPLGFRVVLAPSP